MHSTLAALRYFGLTELPLLTGLFVFFIFFFFFHPFFSKRIQSHQPGIRILGKNFKLCQAKEGEEGKKQEKQRKTLKGKNRMGGKGFKEDGSGTNLLKWTHSIGMSGAGDRDT